MSLPEFDIAGLKVLLVGAGRGEGKGIALAFAEAGADVAITGLTPIGVNRVAEEVRALRRTALPLTGDATESADMDRIAQEVPAGFGRVDTLVNCGQLRWGRYPQAGSEASRRHRRWHDRGGVASNYWT